MRVVPRTRRARRIILIAGGAMLLLAIVRQVTGAVELTSSANFGAALRLAVPIALAGLGGLYAERTGIINIGLEGMMILGTWSAGWAGWHYGVWWGVAFGVLGGIAGALLHSVATVNFGVDHIISGVAINILALGVARFLSVVIYVPGTGGGSTQSPRVQGDVGEFTLPFLAGGKLGPWRTPDLFGGLERLDWFLVSDIGGLLKGLTGRLSLLTIIALLLIPFTWWFLWRTPLGLRLRSAGENPYAAESLGVPVYTVKHIGVLISGALAGLGGAFLVVEAAGIYREGQTGGRGFIGLASMIFGNWRPTGTWLGAGLFGFTDALQLRSEGAVHALLLFLAVALIAVALQRWRKPRAALVSLAGGAAFFTWFLVTDTVPNEFVFFTPHVVTILVLVFASQRLRMPAADGLRYRKGEIQ
ncbi:MAG: ABC transporter permease [Nitriliruptorales bacterium]